MSTENYKLSPEAATRLQKAVLESLRPDLVLEKFGGKIVKTTWRERISDLLHFRWPSGTKIVMKKELPMNVSATVRFRRYVPLEIGTEDCIKE